MQTDEIEREDELASELEQRYGRKVSCQAAFVGIAREMDALHGNDTFAVTSAMLSAAAARLFEAEGKDRTLKAIRHFAASCEAVLSDGASTKVH